MSSCLPADLASPLCTSSRGPPLSRAAEIDLGFDPAVLAQMLGSLSRFRDDEVPVEPADTDALRCFFSRWRKELDPES